MTEETLSKIHNEYLNAVLNGKDILSILKNLYEGLSKLTVPEDDRRQFGLFLHGVDGCIKYREKTNEYTSLVTALTTTFVYIIIFMNKRKGKNWDANIVARRKALERDLTKVLRKAIESSNTCVSNTSIRDRFGARFVLLNDKEFDQESLYSALHEISDSVQGILCKTDLQLRNEFLEFISEIKNPLIRPQIATILDLPFESDFFKDYVKNPKENGYQSIHFCLRVISYSAYFSGAEIELQIRSQEMDENAATGSTHGHDYYVAETSADIKNIFHIPFEMFQNISVCGFTSYIPGVGDIDGIGSEKLVISRRVSASLIPIYK